MFERIENSQNMIKTIFPQLRYLVYYGELFSVLSWQVFKGHFKIIIFSVCLSRAATLLCGLVCLCWVSCNLETEMSVIDWISALIISGTICVLSVVKASFSNRSCSPTTLFAYLLYGYSFNFIGQCN